MDEIYRNLVRLNEEWAEAGLARQVRDPESKYDGGIIHAETGVPSPNHLNTPAVMASWAGAFCNPDSRRYRDPLLLDAFEAAAVFMVNRQHADGTVSLGSTNYNSPPDTAFVVGGLSQVYRLLGKDGWREAEAAAQKVKLFLERTIPALLTGGAHTPNHRWVITAALAQLYEIFSLPELLDRAREWLAEGLDITEDGEWTERSNGIYNAVSNISLYHTARVMNRPELLDYVRRNLRMMIYLVHPDGDVVTDYSGRQDLGQTFDLSNYFLVCRLMAAHDRDPLMASLSDKAASYLSSYREGVNNHPMVGLLLFPSGLDGMGREPLPDTYRKAFNLGHPVREHLRLSEETGHHGKIQHSSMHYAFGFPVVRIREKDTSITMMAQAPSFFALRHGRARLLGVKLSSSFLPGVVPLEELQVEEDRYTFRTVMEKGYSGPIPAEILAGLPAREGASPWYLLPHQHRPVTHLQKHALGVEAVPVTGGWRLRVFSDEREDVFTQLTLVLGQEGTVEGDGVEEFAANRYFLKKGSVTYAAGPDRFEISGGVFDHRLGELRNDTFPPGCKYLHFNLLTPFDHTIELRLL